ncbi:MAG: PQQ-binding-like beta-propeller repeat protein [Bacteroidetes bacterium]|nr:PQQ-binding-like beta-propeller repeat protein [Bacteroidota bacterium]
MKLLRLLFIILIPLVIFSCKNDDPDPENTKIFIGSYDNQLYAFNSNGTGAWNFNLGTPTSSAPAVVGDLVVTGDHTGMVWVVNTNDGTEFWRYNTGMTVYSSPVIQNNTVYVANQMNKVFALDMAWGDRVWDYTAPGVFSSSPTVVNAVLYVG